MRPFALTPAQMVRLSGLPEDMRVVGAHEDCPLVLSAEGRLMRVDHDGAIKRATPSARRAITEKMIDLIHPVL